jgi:hypothetical protein
MLIERRPWLVLLCLPLLAVSNARLHANGTWEPTDDLFALWRSFSATTQQNMSTEVPSADTPYPWWSPEGSNDSGSYVPPAPPAVPVLGPSQLLAEVESDVPSINLWDQPDKKPRKVSQKSEGFFGSLSTQVEVTDAPVARIWDDPTWKRTWQTNDSWQLGVAGPVSVFGQLGANSDEAGQSDMKVNGRTGLAWKVPVGSLAEFTFRSGPGVSYTDPLHPLHTQGRSDWLLEVQARWPLLFGIGLEYQGSATPSLTPMQQDMVNQDVRLAFPVGSTGKLKVGAKHQWTGLLDQRGVWTDSMQLYLGLELSR